MKSYKIEYGHSNLGNGITVFNVAKNSNNIVAYINNRGKITWHDKYIPHQVKVSIKEKRNNLFAIVV